MSRSLVLLGVLFLSLVPFAAVQADDVMPGFDFFTTPPGGGVLDVGGGGTADPTDDIPPLPPDFFFSGSPVFTGVISFAGVPLAPGSNADTVVERLATAVLPSVPSSDTIPIELVSLSLTSVDPITVGTTEWDVTVTLSPSDPSPGSMTLFHSTPTGGTYDATIDICGLHTFTQVVGPSPGTTVEFENCADLSLPLTVAVFGQLWDHTAPPPPVGPPPPGAGPNFFIPGPQADSGPHPSMNPAKTTAELCGDTYPECDGECPPNLSCQEDPGAGECICVTSVPLETRGSRVALFLLLAAASALLTLLLPLRRRA